MSLKERIEKFKYPARGFRIAWEEEHSFRFHVAWALLTLLTALVVRVPYIEMLIIIAMIGFVLVAELLNTALEELCDKFQPTHDPHIAKIKDLASAAVSSSAITATLIGLIIIVPRFFTFIASL